MSIRDLTLVWSLLLWLGQAGVLLLLSMAVMFSWAANPEKSNSVGTVVRNVKIQLHSPTEVRPINRLGTKYIAIFNPSVRNQRPFQRPHFFKLFFGDSPTLRELRKNNNIEGSSFADKPITALVEKSLFQSIVGIVLDNIKVGTFKRLETSEQGFNDGWTLPIIFKGNYRSGKRYCGSQSTIVRRPFDTRIINITATIEMNLRDEQIWTTTPQCQFRNATASLGSTDASQGGTSTELPCPKLTIEKKGLTNKNDGLNRANKDQEPSESDEPVLYLYFLIALLCGGCEVWGFCLISRKRLIAGSLVLFLSLIFFLTDFGTYAFGSPTAFWGLRWLL